MTRSITLNVGSINPYFSSGNGLDLETEFLQAAADAVVEQMPDVTRTHARGEIAGQLRGIDWSVVGRDEMHTFTINAPTKTMLEVYDEIPREFMYGIMEGYRTALINKMRQLEIRIVVDQSKDLL